MILFLQPLNTHHVYYSLHALINPAKLCHSFMLFWNCPQPCIKPFALNLPNQKILPTRSKRLPHEQYGNLFDRVLYGCDSKADTMIPSKCSIPLLSYLAIASWAVSVLSPTSFRMWLRWTSPSISSDLALSLWNSSSLGYGASMIFLATSRLCFNVSRFKVAMMNLRPRKCLNYKTPYEVHFSKVLHLA